MKRNEDIAMTGFSQFLQGSVRLALALGIVGVSFAVAQDGQSAARDCRMGTVSDPNTLGVPALVCPLQPVSPALSDSPWCCSGRPPQSAFEYSQRQNCPDSIVTQANNQQMDAIVVLGAGRLQSGGPHCHAVQRVHIAWQLVESARARQPNLPIVFSGANLTTEPELVEPVDRSCLVTRLARRLEQARARSAPAPELQRLSRSLELVRASTNPVRLTEADQMCGLLLRRYPEGPARSEILARIIFEDQAQDTQQNAEFSIRALQQWNQGRNASGRVRHPVVVTTNPANQDHALRSLGNFRAVSGAPGLSFHSVSCPHETSSRAPVFY